MFPPRKRPICTIFSQTTGGVPLNSPQGHRSDRISAPAFPGRDRAAHGKGMSVRAPPCARRGGRKYQRDTSGAFVPPSCTKPMALPFLCLWILDVLFVPVEHDQPVGITAVPQALDRFSVLNPTNQIADHVANGGLLLVKPCIRFS